MKVFQVLLCLKCSRLRLQILSFFFAYRSKAAIKKKLHYIEHYKETVNADTQRKIYVEFGRMHKRKRKRKTVRSLCYCNHFAMLRPSRNESVLKSQMTQWPKKSWSRSAKKEVKVKQCRATKGKSKRCLQKKLCLEERLLGLLDCTRRRSVLSSTLKSPIRVKGIFERIIDLPLFIHYPPILPSSRQHCYILIGSSTVYRVTVLGLTKDNYHFYSRYSTK